MTYQKLVASRLPALADASERRIRLENTFVWTQDSAEQGSARHRIKRADSA